MRSFTALRADLHRGVTRIISLEKDHESDEFTRIWYDQDVLIFIREICEIRGLHTTVTRLIVRGVSSIRPVVNAEMTTGIIISVEKDHESDESS